MAWPPPPRVSILGLALIELHFGMCRSAAFALKRRPQCGQGTRSSSSSRVATGGGSGLPEASASEICFPALIAA
eukprot:scaffold42382_cov59-Phaeocystis_antarctica.AAC.2